MAVSSAPHARTARPDVWHGRYGPALALALVALPLAAALAWALSLTSVDQSRFADTISATAMTVDEHATAMVRVGERVAAASLESTTAERGTWIAYGEHMVADGAALRALAQSLRGAADVIRTDPTKAWRVDTGILRARWEHLRADGSATAAHGRAMVEQARIMADAGRRLGLVTADDVREIERASLGMVDAGERTVRIANSLMGSLDQMRRWMGR